MKALVVSPKFHGYWRSIVGGFDALGHETCCIRYDEWHGMGARAIAKLRLDLPERFGRDQTTLGRKWATDWVVGQLRAHNADVVVVVKGDLLDPNLWETFQRKNVPVVLWLYDELRRTRHTTETLGAYSAVASYSPNDCEAMASRGIRSRFVPLAFDPRLAISGGTSSTEVVFVGARYPSRADLLADLVRRGITVRAYGRDWSRRTVDRLRTLDWFRPRVPGAPDVSRERAAGLMQRALTALNLHGDQDGFNIRTFEACGVGAVQLIDRPEVKAFYDPGEELLTFDGVDELVAQIERVKSDEARAGRIRHAGRERTLANHTFEHRCADLLDLC